MEVTQEGSTGLFCGQFHSGVDRVLNALSVRHFIAKRVFETWGGSSNHFEHR